MIIGLTGYFGSGKGTVADYLVKLGFSYHSCSDILRDELSAANKEHTIENFITLGNELREKHGAGVLAERLLKKIKDSKEEFALVDSLRHPDEINALKESGDFHLFSIEASTEIRFERIQIRKRPEDKISYEEFKKQEEFQIAGKGHQAQLLNCRKMADFNVVNEGTVEELQQRVDEILKEIKYEPNN